MQSVNMLRRVGLACSLTLMLQSCGTPQLNEKLRTPIDESLLVECDTGRDLASTNLAGIPAVTLIDDKDALLSLCAQRQAALAASARKVTGQ